MDIKHCNFCNLDKPLNEFWLKKRSKDGRDNKCSNCSKQYQKNLYKANPNRQKKIKEVDKRIRLQNKLLIQEWLSDKECVDCGNKDYRVFDFDHVRGIAGRLYWRRSLNVK